ncbi:MAG: cadmium-translocating P-type ATPase [Lachnospiraceae bacterium]|nr:cadmium-translocating P-type ATPase [Lachnospiraceae bacterium]
MTKKQKKTLYRIIISGVLFFILLILEKTHVLESLPIWGRLLLFAVPYLIIGYDIILKAAKNIAHGHVFDENFLMMVATFAAFGIQEYTEGCAVMLFYQVGELFQSYAVGKSRQSITEMMSIAPDFANLEKEDGSTEEVDPDEVEVGSVIVIRAGEKVPLDGRVLEGSSFLDTSALTGESVPRRVHEGEEVISGCINGEGVLRVQVLKPYEESTVARILDLVENASSKKSRMENFITRFAKYYTPVVTIGAVLLAIVPPLLFHQDWGEWIRRACTFLIVSCPCALVISVPLGFFGGIGAASRIGVLVKGSNYLEAVSELKTIVFDKTGTLTKGEFVVKSIFAENDFTKEQVLEAAAHGESLSTHPIARSILNAYGKEIEPGRVSEVSEIPGHGLKVLYNGRELYIGNSKLMDSQNIVYTTNEDAGTVVYVAQSGVFAGSIVISDTIKEGAAEAIADMKKVGIKKTVMLTGDRKKAAEAVGSELGIDLVCSDLLPADKVSQVEALMMAQDMGVTDGKLGFVGDGINDAPVLMRSDVGIAMGSLGSDAAIEAADIVLMDDDIRKIARVVKIAAKTRRIVRENVVFALGVKLLVLLLGALGFASLWAAVFADVGVAVLAILNSMRALKES